MESMEVSGEEWTLDPDVYQLLCDNASVDDVFDAWAHAYGEVEPHPRVANCMQECVNVLACFAVYFEADNLLKYVMPLCSPFCKFSPHITAMYEGDLAMAEVIQKAIPTMTIYEYYVEYSTDFGNRLDHVWPNTKGYGCIKDDSINVGEEISVAEILFKWDDREALEFVFQFNIGFFHPLADMAQRFKSKECLMYIQDKIVKTEAVEPPHKNYTNLLQMLLGCVSRQDGTITQFHTECAISQWAALRDTPRTRRFLSSTEETMLTSLMDSHCIKQSVLQQLCSSLTDDALHELHHNVILENCATLLAKMTCSLSDSTHGVVPMQVVTNIIRTVHCVLASVHLAVGKSLIASCRSLKLFNAISKMVMQAGIQAPVCRYCSTVNCILVGSCSCYDGFEINSIKNFFKTMMFVERKLAGFLDDMNKEIFQLAHEHLMILLASGHMISDYCELYKPQNVMLDGERTLVKLMPHSCFNSHRQFYYEMYNSTNKLIISLEKKNNRTAEEEAHLNRLRQTCGEDYYICGLDRERSLKELCRIKLYEIVPKGKMPQYVEHLNLSREQKDFLSLGVRTL